MSDSTKKYLKHSALLNYVKYFQPNGLGKTNAVNKRMLVTYDQYHKENGASRQKVNSSGAWETLSSDLRHAVIKKMPDEHARNVYMS